ncbi:proline oxidase-like protein [Microdochium bolleyi]|uniref:Proline dehydrogenase n=1 Tax=Microdochium bolleyi TaxID=196109 RepID=A0A136IKM0_9PEZI|nr:proline oxidase-like protein [Microdochium bolleyi]
MMLLRSLFISTISSHRFLLLPSLSVLQYLTKPHTSKLLNVDKNPIIHGILKRTFYNQFCAGETGAETRHCVRTLKDLGFRGVILTYARETVFDHKTQSAHGLLGAHQEKTSAAAEETDTCIEEWKNGTLETAALVEEGDFLALKLTGAGPRVTTAFAAGHLAPEQMLSALRTIAGDCKARGVRIIVDAESQHFQAGINATTLQLMREFNKITPTSSSPAPAAVVYNTYQAYLKSTPAVVASHMIAAHQEGFTLGLKLVRGAYILSDDRRLICDTKADTDAAYNSISRGVLKRELGEFGGLYGKHAFPATDLFIASHNRESVLGAYRLHRERVDEGLPTVRVAFGQLHGMSDEVSFGLLAEGEADVVKREEEKEKRLGVKSNGVTLGSSRQARLDRVGAGGPDVFKCTTWGSMSECIAYLTRRAVENRDAVLRTKDEYNALKAEAWQRLFRRA